MSPPLTRPECNIITLSTKTRSSPHDGLCRFNFSLATTAAAACRVQFTVIIVYALCFHKNRSAYLSKSSRHNIIILRRQRIASTHVFSGISPQRRLVFRTTPPPSIPSPSFVFRSNVFHFFVTTSAAAVVVVDII